jgi:hypothetical protein
MHGKTTIKILQETFGRQQSRRRETVKRALDKKKELQGVHWMGLNWIGIEFIVRLLQNNVRFRVP